MMICCNFRMAFVWVAVVFSAFGPRGATAQAPAAGTNPAAAAAPANLLKPTHKLESWRLETTEGGKATAKASDEAITFNVTAVTGTDWHVQAVQTGLDLQEGKEYTLKFKAQSEAPATLGVNAMIDEDDWHNIGLGETPYVGKTEQEFSLTFRAESVHTAKKNRISFVLGTETGTITLRNVSLVAR